MSTQSILVRNFANYQEEFDKKLIQAGDDYSRYRRFMIGEPFDYDKMMFVKSFHKLLCTDSCELTNYIQSKIEGNLEYCETPRTFTQAYAQYNKQVKSCSVTEAIEDCCDWKLIEW